MISKAEVEKLASPLPRLSEPALERLAGGSKKERTPLHIYLLLLTEAQDLDVSDQSEAAGFQRRFNGFYGVRRNHIWRERYYHEFQASKASGLPIGLLFADVLNAMSAATGRIEASFVSKLIATIRPDSAIIDSVVRGYAIQQLGSVPKMVGLEGAASFYGWLNATMVALLETGPARDWFAQFDRAFARVPGAVGITNMKKLDFLIWGGADR